MGPMNALTSVPQYLSYSQSLIKAVLQNYNYRAYVLQNMQIMHTAI